MCAVRQARLGLVRAVSELRHGRQGVARQVGYGWFGRAWQARHGRCEKEAWRGRHGKVRCV